MLITPSCIFQRRTTDAQPNKNEVIQGEMLSSDLSLVSDCGKANLVLSNSSKTQILQLKIYTGNFIYLVLLNQLSRS